jgi:cysteine desulfurase/selenocysteine lyase
MTTTFTLDAREIRRQFPFFQPHPEMRSVVYLDNAATTQKPYAVIEAVSNFWAHHNANVHRGGHGVGAKASELYEAARARVAQFLNAREAAEIVFTRGTTEAINLVASSWGESVRQGGRRDHRHRDGASRKPAAVDATRREAGRASQSMAHHRRRQAESGRLGAAADRAHTPRGGVAHLECAGHGEPREPRFASGRTPRARCAWWTPRRASPTCPSMCKPSIATSSPSRGTRHTDRQESACCTPSVRCWRRCRPTMSAAGMVQIVRWERLVWAEPPAKFEAGTPPIAEAIGLHAALDFIDAIGRDAIERYEHELTEYALARLQEVPDLRLHGPIPDRAGIFAFSLGEIHPHDIATVLDTRDIAIRVGAALCASAGRAAGRTDRARQPRDLQRHAAHRRAD